MLDPRKVIVCRCEDVTLYDIEKAIDEGMDDLELLKRKLRIGMGPCQGSHCLLIAASILARKKGLKISDIRIPVSRPPIVPVKLKYFLGESRDGL
ncbi:(2Fe-2S)-binding protein [Thermogladius sp. 4427co]|uniref:(2Fe-2S)-binding protein n=1 Tax=Thermogladius sp. 4427co TaxID=3450718 RepID=UPI003F79FE34